MPRRTVPAVPRLEYADYLAHIRRDSARFREVLAGCDPAAPVPSCPDWSAVDLLWHLTDAELTAGCVTSLAADLAADGVDEALDVMYGHLPDWGTFDPLPRYVEFRISDAGTSVWTQIGTFAGTAPDGEVLTDEKDMHVVPDPGVPADVVVTGDAAAMDAWLWRRRDDAGITVTGDRGTYDHARGVLDHPIT